MQGFRGGSDAVDISAIAWSWRVSTLCVVVMGLRVIGVSIVLMWGLGLCGPNAGGEDGYMQSDRSSMRHASIVLTEPVERAVMNMFSGQRNQYINGE